jgi:AraC-like DNA-binding protein
MILQTHKPAFPLNGFVENLVYYHGLTALHNVDRFLPDGKTEIILDLTENPQYIYDNETLQEIQICRHAWVSGVRTRPITIPSGKGSRMLIVAFKKGRAYPFYPFPMSELTDTVAEADLVFGRKFHDMRQQLLAAKSPERMFQLVESSLLQQAGGRLQEETPARCIAYAVSSIIQKPTARRLSQLSDEIGYSQKHFIDLFRQHVGVSPKQYLRIMRFQKAIGVIENKECIRWGDIALESGYFDQAHFIHDFKHFSGFTPNEYMKRKAVTLNYVPVD